MVSSLFTPQYMLWWLMVYADCYTTTLKYLFTHAYIFLVSYVSTFPSVGGPGCSSFNCGVMFENSPVTTPLHPAGYCCLDTHEPLVYNQFAWTNATHMLYVE
jgi:hypothetical protein